MSSRAMLGLVRRKATVPSHSFTLTSGNPFGQAAWRGWKQADSRSGEQGSAANTSFNTPDGVARQIQFLIAMSSTSVRLELTDLTPEAQMPTRFVLERSGVKQEFGSRTGYADRFGAQADYSAVSGNAITLMPVGQQVNVTLYWD